MTDLDKPMRQEQEAASDDVVEVAPGVLRMQLPLDLPGLGHVNCYALTDRRGVALVDPGMPGPRSAAVLEARLANAGYAPRHVHTVVVTHSHIDHFGGARQFVKAGAEVVGHELLRNWWDPTPDTELSAVSDALLDESVLIEHDSNGHPVNPWTGRAWAPPPEVQEHIDRMQAVDPEFFAIPTPTKKLADADRVVLAGREWFALWTPGHTPDHLCLYDPTEGVVLSGDHVLPTITPHISGIGAGADPLSRFFQSLDRMHDLSGVTQVLPAHGHPFTDLDGRVDAIREHHSDRLGALRSALDRVGEGTVEDLAHELFRPQSWGQMADSETYAHLEHLRLLGQADRSESGGLLRYRTHR